MVTRSHAASGGCTPIVELQHSPELDDGLYRLLDELKLDGGLTLLLGEALLDETLLGEALLDETLLDDDELLLEETELLEETDDDDTVHSVYRMASTSHVLPIGFLS